MSGQIILALGVNGEYKNGIWGSTFSLEFWSRRNK